MNRNIDRKTTILAGVLVLLVLIAMVIISITAADDGDPMAPGPMETKTSASTQRS